ncbi:hypothetical protein EAO27_19255 [Sphingopyxis sp. YF1]|uniref:hypothetical protein n=1 Tax=unclassified Sphingopyxis TaxID=2614943 RepID=UPI001F622C7E|nr:MULTISPECIES: hypothetical protein [unclassified Sphingopyxis]UNU44609.1 hypothetical protein EAO27_19255 [Sphingopyxis sp. YF1]USI76653.1 hypothetical protein KEC45_18180 [Sphingopyxis sp. USTB-05]
MITALLLAAASPAVPDWSGHWEGTLINFPERGGAPPITISRDIGPWPTQDATCTPFVTTYREAGVVKGVKDYKLCRGTGADDLYIDEGAVPEGPDVRLPARLFGDTLVSIFKYRDLLLLVSTQTAGGIMTEDIVTAKDVPAGDAVVQLNGRSLQRLELRRSEKGHAP